MSSMPTGRPSASTTGSSLIFRAFSRSMASPSRASGPITTGFFVMTVSIGASSASSRRDSNSRARSLSVNSPASRPSSSTSMIAPVRRPVCRTCANTLAHGVGRGGDPQFAPAPHALRDGRELAAQAPGGVELRELFRGELPLFEQRERERVAERDHDGRAGARRERERARFGDRAVDDRGVGAAGERAAARCR